MPKELLNEREFELINIVGGELAANQRDLSRHMNMSLGMTNMILRRLISKGYIRIHQLNKKKTEYLLTPKGFSEKMQKSIKYTIKTITSISLIKKRFKESLSQAYAQGERNFYVLGESDFALLVEVVLKELNPGNYTVHYIKDYETALPDGILCICKEGFELKVEGQRHINFFKELAQDKEFTTHTLKE
jgi:DNA-binding MarR family transcriptional regulator